MGSNLIANYESVFAVISGMIVLHQIPTSREAIGCILMFAAIIVAQLPEKKLTKQSEKLKVES